MDWVARARMLALEAHAGQVDKAGHPYIGHVGRVAAAVRGDDEAEAVAWLHDVIETARPSLGRCRPFPPRCRTRSGC